MENQATSIDREEGNGGVFQVTLPDNLTPSMESASMAKESAGTTSVEPILPHNYMRIPGHYPLARSPIFSGDAKMERIFAK